MYILNILIKIKKNCNFTYFLQLTIFIFQVQMFFFVCFFSNQFQIFDPPLVQRERLTEVGVLSWGIADWHNVAFGKHGNFMT